MFPSELMNQALCITVYDPYVVQAVHVQHLVGHEFMECMHVTGNRQPELMRRMGSPWK
jgi:hypothetical protein